MIQHFRRMNVECTVLWCQWRHLYFATWNRKTYKKFKPYFFFKKLGISAWFCCISALHYSVSSSSICVYTAGRPEDVSTRDERGQFYCSGRCWQWSTPSSERCTAHHNVWSDRSRHGAYCWPRTHTPGPRRPQRSTLAVATPQGPSTFCCVADILYAVSTLKCGVDCFEGNVACEIFFSSICKALSTSLRRSDCLNFVLTTNYVRTPKSHQSKSSEVWPCLPFIRHMWMHCVVHTNAILKIIQRENIYWQFAKPSVRPLKAQNANGMIVSEYLVYVSHCMI